MVTKSSDDVKIVIDKYNSKCNYLFIHTPKKDFVIFFFGKDKDYFLSYKFYYVFKVKNDVDYIRDICEFRLKYDLMLREIYL